MALTDREAADMRTAQAVSEVRGTFSRGLAASGGNDALAFRNGLRASVSALSTRLIEIYAELDLASEPAGRDALIATINERVSAFIQSSVRGRRGADAAAAVREGARLSADATFGITSKFDLAVYEHVKKRRHTTATSAASPGEAPPLLLFLSANPDLQSPLEVEKEQNRIAKVRNASKHQDRVRIESLPDLDIIELAKSLRLHRPLIIHFSGHGAPDGSLLMRDQEGATYEMHAQGLSKLIAMQKDTLRLVVLNACFSSALADLLVGDIDCVIGMTDAVYDAAAILFARAFYGALFDGHPVGEAFAEATALVEARYNDEANIPIIKMRPGVDAATFRLVQ